MTCRALRKNRVCAQPQKAAGRKVLLAALPPFLSVRKGVPEPRGPAEHEKVTCFYTVYKFITILLQFLQVYYTTFPYNESIRQNLRKIKVVRRELS